MPEGTNKSIHPFSADLWKQVFFQPSDRTDQFLNRFRQ